MVDDSTRKQSRSAQRPEMLVALGIFVLLSRVPFIGAGHGADHDAWKVAVAARTISESDSYVASRLPGTLFRSLLIHICGEEELPPSTAQRLF